MTTPRPDQLRAFAEGGQAGSRSGAGDVAGALGYPGSPPAVVNCQAANLIQQNVGMPVFFTFPSPGRIWTVVLSYVVTSNNSYAVSTTRTFAAIQTGIGGLTLAIIDLGVANPNQVTSGQSEPPLNGLPVVKGETLILNVNGGSVVTNVDQQASAVVMYSIP